MNILCICIVPTPRLKWFTLPVGIFYLVDVAFGLLLCNITIGEEQHHQDYNKKQKVCCVEITLSQH